jgi:hypothetical protein
MTTLSARAVPRSSAIASLRWHKPLLVLAAAMALLALYAGVARFVDPGEITGANAWDKPLKFALSTVIYSITWSWLIPQLRAGRRLASVLGSVITVALAVELAVIVGAAAVGTTSHFNVATPLAAALWATMAVSISVLWVATLVVSILLFRNPLGDRARTLAIRTGAVIAVVGLALGFLMTSPTAAQLNDFQGVAGAHTVGLADGGPGLPILGWSTVAGDLRIPHFVGMHALQAIPIALIVLEVLSRRVGLLRSERLRLGIVWTAALAYAAVVALVTAQALRGEAITRPGAISLAGAAVIAAAVLAALVVLVARDVRHPVADSAGVADPDSASGARSARAVSSAG